MKRITIFYFLVNILMLCACSVVSKNGNSLFKIKDAYYQSWMVNENEKGTTIIVELSNVKSGVEFDSLVFRGNRLSVATNIDGDKLILTSILNVGIERLIVDKKPVNLPDQLIYRSNDKKYSNPIPFFKRKETRYLKK